MKTVNSIRREVKVTITELNVKECALLGELMRPTAY